MRTGIRELRKRCTETMKEQRYKLGKNSRYRRIEPMQLRGVENGNTAGGRKAKMGKWNSKAGEAPPVKELRSL